MHVIVFLPDARELKRELIQRRSDQLFCIRFIFFSAGLSDHIRIDLFLRSKISSECFVGIILLVIHGLFFVILLFLLFLLIGHNRLSYRGSCFTPAFGCSPWKYVIDCVILVEGSGLDPCVHDW